MYIYIVAATGGDLPPQYEVKGTEAAAVKLAEEWAKHADPGEDFLDILRMDLRSPLKLMRRKTLDKKSVWED